MSGGVRSNRSPYSIIIIIWTLAVIVSATAPAAASGLLPDGRTVTPYGFTIPVEGFASSEAMSPDGKWIAVLSQDGGAIDVLATGEDAHLVARLSEAYASGLTWTVDGLFVTRGYTGAIARFAYSPELSKETPALVKRDDIVVGGLLNGVAEDPATHRIAIARTAEREIDILDDRTGTILHRLAATGQPFSVGFSGESVVATIYNSNHVDVWPTGSTAAIRVATGAHPTALLIRGGTAYVADADGSDVGVVDIAAHALRRELSLSIGAFSLAGQTPSGMALSSDGSSLFVAESGFNDVAVVDVRTRTVRGRIPTGWYPMAVLYRYDTTIDKDDRKKPQLWILSAQGLGPQPDPGSEWNGWYTGFVQHLLVEPNRFAQWSKQVADNNHFAIASPPRSALPPIAHVVFIVQENKHFDEVFGDEPRANADPALLVYGRRFTPNAHALAERYALFDNFMGDGQASIYGHSWATQGFANDYLQRNAHTPDDPAAKNDKRVAESIWPSSQTGEDSLTPADMDFDWYRDLAALPKAPRVNVSAVFGPRGELIDALQRKGLSYRVYGEQMTMLPNGHIASGLAAHADEDYPGAHINYGVLDTQRAKLFLDDVAKHGLAAYSYLTLPTDHTAGKKAGFYTPASYVANNDFALGQIVEGLSKRADWSNTVVIVTTDDPQGTGDHVDSHRMPAFAVGPYVRRSFVDHNHYDIPSVLRTVEVLYGIEPLNLYDAEATPLNAAFSQTADVSPFTALSMNIPMTKNPGKAKSLVLELDDVDSRTIPAQEWASVKGSSQP